MTARSGPPTGFSDEQTAYAADPPSVLYPPRFLDERELEAIARKADAWLEANRKVVEALPAGTVVIINVETGDHVSAPTDELADAEFDRRFGKGTRGFVHRVGRPITVGGGLVGTAQGFIDGRFRSLVRVPLAKGDEDFLALLDTGFNGSLLCSRPVALAVGVELDGRSERVELAGGVRQNVERGWLAIIWLGGPRRASVLVTASEPIRTEASDGEPVALIGGALLTPSLVLLDYDAMTVEIEAR